MPRVEVFDLLDPAFIADPFAAYRRLRAIEPVYWHEQLNSWVLTRYHDCARVLGDADTFANDFRRVGIPTPPPHLSLQTIDPPEHTPLRLFAKDALQAQNLKVLEQDALRRANALLDGLEGRESFDFVREFADPFTLGTICQLVGVDMPDQNEEWARLNDELDRSMDAELAPESEEAGLAARSAFSARVAGWLADNPQRGILAYVAQHLGGVDVPLDVVVNSLRAFWHAGFEVPSRFLANVMSTLVQDGNAMSSLREASNFALATEELVRYCGPVHALSRACTKDVRMGDKTLRRGDIAITFIAAGNRDPEQFDQPERLRWSRSPNPHLGFGRGAHACLGANIARIEARVAIPAILERFKSIGLSGEPILRSNATVRGPARLPISFAAQSVEDRDLVPTRV